MQPLRERPDVRRIGQHSEWTILTGFLPAALAIAVFEVLIDPELVSILVDDLGRGLDSVPSFVRGLVLMSTFVACYVAVCLALLGVLRGPIRAQRLAGREQARRGRRRNRVLDCLPRRAGGACVA